MLATESSIRRTPCSGPRNLAEWLARLGSFVALMLALGGWPAQAAQTPAKARGSDDSGHQAFASLCSGCHGLDGRGAERAPNIAADAEVQRVSDSALANIISRGIPESAMPAFGRLGAARIQSIVLYLRRLQGEGGNPTLAGDEEAGEKLFFGEGGCSGCHMVRGVGGFLGPDLSLYGRNHSAAEARSAILEPGNPGSKTTAVVATLAGGVRLSGIVRNEDNFSIQIQSADGAFHFLRKSDLHGLESEPRSLMPSDYRQRLRPEQLQDLMSYLLRTARPAKRTAQAKGGKP